MFQAQKVPETCSVLAVVNKKLYCPKLHLVGSLYIIVNESFSYCTYAIDKYTVKLHV